MPAPASTPAPARPRWLAVLAWAGLTLLLTVGVIAGGIAALWTGIHMIEPYETGVVSRLGVVHRTVSPGTNFIYPFGIERVQKVRTSPIFFLSLGTMPLQDRDRYSRLFSHGRDPTMIRHHRGRLYLTSDHQLVEIYCELKYQINDPIKFVQVAHEPEHVLRYLSEANLSIAIGNHAFYTLVDPQEREGITQMILHGIAQDVKELDMGIMIRDLEVIRLDPPALVMPSFTEANRAQQRREPDTSPEHQDRPAIP